jgi:hypothetical protein
MDPEMERRTWIRIATNRRFHPGGLRQRIGKVLTVQTIRVALLDMKPMLRDMLTGVIARERDMQLTHCLRAEAAELVAIRPDVLVCEMEDALDLDLPRRLLGVLPRARVLVVADAGDQAAVYELRPTREVLLGVSIEQVIDAIRFGPDPADGLCGAPAGRIRQD